MKAQFPGFFISFEGIDGAGKSTHIESFGKHLQERYPHRDIVMTREPGGTKLGEQLRALLLDAPMHLETEALLMLKTIGKEAKSASAKYGDNAWLYFY
jgi:dTMP kinase